MSTHVLLNLLNTLGKGDQMRGLQMSFCNEFNKFNNIGTGKLEYIYHMTLYYLKSHFWRTNVKI